MDTSAPVMRDRAAWPAIAVANVLRVLLVIAALAIARPAPALWEEVTQRSRAEFSFDVFRSPEALLAHASLILAAFVFTLACRLPLRRGVAWAPIALAIVPLALGTHVVVFFAFFDAFADIGWMNPRYFFDQDPVRWALVALVGVAIGCGVGKAASQSAQTPSAGRTSG